MTVTAYSCLLGDYLDYHVSPLNHMDLPVSKAYHVPFSRCTHHQLELIMCQDPSLASHLSDLAD